MLARTPSELRRACFRALLTLAFAACAGAHAQAVDPPKPVAPAISAPAASANAPAEPSLEDLLRVETPGAPSDLSVSAASRMAQSADLAPAVTYVVTRQDIQRLGLRSMADVLRRFPGMHVREQDAFARIALRGVAPGDFNTRVLFLLDGMRLNENIYDAGQIDRDFAIDISLIERVEFLPGPGSALYGNNAMLGVVNVVTQRADQLAGVRVGVSLAPRGNTETRLSYAKRTEAGAEWLLAAGLTEIPNPELIRGLLRGFESEIRPFNWDRAKRLLLSYRSGGLHLRLGGVDRLRGMPTFLEVNEVWSQSDDETYHRFANVQWDGKLGDTWDLQLNLAQQQLRYRLLETLEFESGDLLGSEFEALGRWWNAEARVGRPLGEHHYLLAGFEWQDDREQRFTNAFEGFDPLVSKASSSRIGLFVQDEWALGERQRLVVGARWDDIRNRVRRWSPRVSYVWSPQPSSSFKLLWGNAFRAPNRFQAGVNAELDYELPRSESVRTLEMSWETQLNSTWRYRAAAFTTRFKDLIAGAVPDGQFANFAMQRTQGFDVSVDGRWASGLQVQLAWSHQNSRSPPEDSLSSLVANNLVQWSLTAPLWQPDWRLAVHGAAQSKRRSTDGRRMPGYGVTHANLLWQQSRQSEWALGVQNLGGRSYTEPRGRSTRIPDIHDGERWRLSWLWRFEP